MYLPKHFEETRIEVMHELICAYPLATLVTLSSEGINANHIPLIIKEDGSQFGTLIGHVARLNTVWSDFNSEVEVLAVFQGDNVYITPSWYATKAETGRVVPTWNYAVVHAHGTMRIIDDPVWIRTQIEALTARHESSFPTPWAVGDAPHEFTESLIASIIGIEIPISRLVGKWKMSQNQPEKNRIGIAAGLKENKNLNSASIARLVKT